MKFAIINDMHLSSPDTGYEFGVQRKLVGESERLIRQFVDEMNSKEKPSFVMNLGDSIEDVKNLEGDTYYFKKAIELLSGLRMPVYFLIGNHDVKTNSADDIARLLGYKKMYYSFDTGGFHFVATSFVQLPKGDSVERVLSSDEKMWLVDDLDNTDKPTIVFTHYGLADDDMKGNFWFETIPDRAVLADRSEIRQILEESGKVKAVISAHQHWNRMFVYNGLPYFTVTSLVENTNNDGIPAGAYTTVNINKESIDIKVHGNDPAHYEFKF